jgi:AcrR family transcriptional regulator
MSPASAAPRPAPPAPAGRRERKKARLRRRIRDEAVALFDERGFEATRVTEICARADIAEKTFFNHFPSKQHLLREIAGAALEELLARIETSRRAAGGVAGRLRDFFERLARETGRRGPMHRQLLTEMVHAAHETGTDSEQTLRLHRAFAGLVAGPGALADPAPTELVMGAFYVLMFNWASLEGYPLRERALAAAELLAAALSPREAARARRPPAREEEDA